MAYGHDPPDRVVFRQDSRPETGDETSMRTSVVIERRSQTVDGIASFVMKVSGRFGGGYTRSMDCDLDQIVASAASAMLQYAQCNPEGGDLIAPADVVAKVPEHLRSIARSGE